MQDVYIIKYSKTHVQKYAHYLDSDCPVKAWKKTMREKIFDVSVILGCYSDPTFK